MKIFTKKPGIRREERLFFVENLSLMVKAGLPLSRAMEVLARQAGSARWKQVLSEVHADLAKGNSFEASLARHPQAFDPPFVSMVRVGELKGNLAEVLDHYYKFLFRSEAIRKKIQAAVTYPAVVVGSMFIVGIVMVVYILPRILDIFREIDVPLPLPTRLAIAMANGVVSYGWIILGVLILAIVVLVAAGRTKRGKVIWQIAVLKMPVIGPVIKELNISIIARNMGTLLEAGVNLAEAFEAAADAAGSAVYRQSLLDVRDSVNRGLFMHEAYAAFPDLYPQIMVQVITVGEEAGVTDTVLLSLAGHYEARVERFFETIATVIEPVLIFIIGLAVAFMAFAILLPIYSLAQA
ncbi:hypothetical protein A3F28_00385 [Candidatus Uhrbacteria bacterium RIFCSPHIGHO2_12_FULL_57_11]|uniref:Type II secretion system protein GspF domain-containing protein n=1 Tax=Candidatus Uhrbacteria bacterium RIFCSPHIGHO2_12_FULL_57_11 TaxID=1802398 RepID=A0A1F7UJ70_9BACT|nr:MAG: hypothetical protein A3F28_00385 [Candidatus Uhrbacteria bacterium RIFCSPHIGHO2_12_FULL_57_11]